MKKKKKTIIILILLIIIIPILTIFTIKIFIYKKNAIYYDVRDIESMEISINSGYLSYTYTYEFDFVNNFVICEKEADNWDEETKTYCIDFTDKDAEYFVKRANLYGFFQWKESYESPNTDDGKYVDICIQFKDGSVHETYCYAKFPITYDKMAEVFYKAFGEKIL